MSFKYKNFNVTLENYKSIFSQCTPDILDEIRNAVLDDTQIANYIAICGLDSYKLNQIRLAIREFVPVKYINPKFTAKTIYNIRQAYQKKFNIDSLGEYIGSKTKNMLLDEKTFEKISDMVALGVDITKVNFLKVPEYLVDVYCKGLYQGYPMWLCITDRVVSESYIKLLMQGMRLDIDIHPFVDEEWTENQLRVIFANADKVDVELLLSYITPKFDADIISELIALMKDNIPISQLTLTDEQGYPLYNEYQIIALGKAVEHNLDDLSVFNPKLSDTEMSERIAELIKVKN